MIEMDEQMARTILANLHEKGDGVIVFPTRWAASDRWHRFVRYVDMLLPRVDLVTNAVDLTATIWWYPTDRGPKRRMSVTFEHDGAGLPERMRGQSIAWHIVDDAADSPESRTAIAIAMRDRQP